MNFLPKILDIKTEVLNSADTIRQLRVDVNDVKLKFDSAVCGLKDASEDIVESDLDILGDLKSLRHSLGAQKMPESMIVNEASALPSPRMSKEKVEKDSKN